MPTRSRSCCRATAWCPCSPPRRTSRPRCAPPAAPPTRSSRPPPRRWPRSGSPVTRTSSSRSCPVGSSNASRLPVRWRCVRRSSSRTNPPPSRTRRRGSWCSTGCSRCPTAMAHSCWRRTTRRSPSAATWWSCCTRTNSGNLLPRNIGADPIQGGRPPAMNIVVCVKQVPDTWAEKKLSSDDKTVDRASVDGVMNELDEYAVEEALKIKEAQGGEVTVLSMGPDKAVETIRKALSMGADKAVHVVDPALHGSDALATSYALAKALGTIEHDLVILGVESTDARMSVVPAMLAERLGAAQLTFARKVEVGDGTVKIERLNDAGYEVVEAPTPAVVSVVEKINEPRYPSFKGIMAAKKKPLTTLTIGDAGIDASKVGLDGSGTAVDEVTARPPKQAGQIVKDEGDGGSKLAEFLASQKFV